MRGPRDAGTASREVGLVMEDGVVERGAQVNWAAGAFWARAERGGAKPVIDGKHSQKLMERAKVLTAWRIVRDVHGQEIIKGQAGKA